MTSRFAAALAVVLVAAWSTSAAETTNNASVTNTVSTTNTVNVVNLLPEGSFELLNADGDPEAWVLPNKNDRPWLAGVTARIEQENNSHYLRITTNPEFPGFYSLFTVVPWEPEGKSKVRVSARLRANIQDKPEAPWRGFRAHVGFSREQGSGRNWTMEGDRRLDGLDIQDTTADWVPATDSRAVPEGTKFICIQFIVGGMTGTFDVDDVVVTPE
jgi:hypothetical protein